MIAMLPSLLRNAEYRPITQYKFEPLQNSHQLAFDENDPMNIIQVYRIHVMFIQETMQLLQLMLLG